MKTKVLSTPLCAKDLSTSSLYSLYTMASTTLVIRVIFEWYANAIQTAQHVFLCI